MSEPGTAARTAAGLAGFLALAGAITTGVLVAGGSTPVAAAELARFSSCEEMSAWVETTGVELQERAVLEDGFAVGAPLPAAAGAGEAADTAATGGPAARDEGTGATNTVVEGVDEIDVVELLEDDRALVARNGSLALVDLSPLAVIDQVGGLPPDGRISFADGVVWVAGSAPDGSGVVVRRLRLDGDDLADDGTWTTPGWLVDARRTGAALHVVAVDQPAGPGVLPFEGGPVPCDQVWRPEAGADTPAATLLATLPASGDLQPTAAAEVVGSAAGFHVTATAAYVTTQTWAEEVTTAVHRFDLATLTPTGSGSVPGTVPGPFGLSEHDGHLRVATTAQPTGVAIGVPVEPGLDDPVAGRVAPEPPGGGRGPLAEVFALDLDGQLDIVGRTGRFGHDGESIHGVRFVGETAYVVTFLQTDPFWVLDLSDPSAPAVVGELQIPGFSAYLHPLTPDRVVGFGPDGNGRVAARLFDVADPAAPAVLDEITLGDDSPVAWDHHAFVGLADGRFAVPVNDWSAGRTGVAELRLDGGRLVRAGEASVATDGSFTAERVLPVTEGGWILVGWDRLVDTSGGQLLL